MPGIDLLNQLNPFTALLFDKAVTAFGVTLENALQETVEVKMGDRTRTRPKYKLSDLLAEGFQFPRQDALGDLRGVEGYEEVG